MREETNAPLRRGLKRGEDAPDGEHCRWEETNAPLRRGLKRPPPLAEHLDKLAEETNAPLRRGLKRGLVQPRGVEGPARKPMPRYEGD